MISATDNPVVCSPPVSASLPLRSLPLPLPLRRRLRREPGAGMSAAPITIQIYQQPGESADTLANRVMQMLEAKQRTARLSSYRDDF